MRGARTAPPRGAFAALALALTAAGCGDDAAPVDAGAPDARDAGALEAGPPDAGSRDAGDRDAARGDGGAIDAGGRDAGRADAGPFDAGLHVEIALSVPADANVYGAGHAAAPGGGAVPVAAALPPGAYRILTLTTAGRVDFGDGVERDADGEDAETAGPAPDVGGLAGPHPIGRVRGLLAVFLGDDEPAPPAPAPLRVLGPGFDAIGPEVGQIFFVGDALDEAGFGQGFCVPNDATRVAFGFYDHAAWGDPPGSYDDDTGAIEVTALVR